MQPTYDYDWLSNFVERYVLLQCKIFNSHSILRLKNHHQNLLISYWLSLIKSNKTHNDKLINNNKINYYHNNVTLCFTVPQSSTSIKKVYLFSFFFFFAPPFLDSLSTLSSSSFQYLFPRITRFSRENSLLCPQIRSEDHQSKSLPIYGRENRKP